jgi:hypothetical protein
MQPQHTRPPTCLGRSGAPRLRPGAVLPGDDLHGWVLLGFQLAMAWVVYRTARESERRVAETVAQPPDAAPTPGHHRPTSAGHRTAAESLAEVLWPTGLSLLHSVRRPRCNIEGEGQCCEEIDLLYLST